MANGEGHRRLVLGSGSPRRRELMALLGVPFEIRVPAVEEQARPGEIPAQVPQRLSRLKAEWVAQEIGKEIKEIEAGMDPGIVVAADTVVVHRGDILGKPRDAGQARAMLRRLRGERHLVLSGVTVMDVATGKQIVDLCESKVWMRALGEAEIAAYVASGDPLDKAAAYAIQNAEFAPVEKVAGCPANVMGLPMCHVVRNLHRLGFPLPPSAPTRCEMRYGYVCALADRIVIRDS